jgi:hypothetical protein
LTDERQQTNYDPEAEALSVFHKILRLFSQLPRDRQIALLDRLAKDFDIDLEADDQAHTAQKTGTPIAD